MNTEVLDTLDSTIVSLCNIIKKESLSVRDRIDIVMALARLIEARANVIPKTDVSEIQKNFEAYLEKWSKSKRASFSA